MAKRKPKPKRKRGAGRPTVIIPVRERRLFTALRQGNSRRAACAYAGFSHDALEDKMRGDSTFKAAIEKAEADSERARVRVIVAASRRNWTAAAWLLERRWPEDWGRRDIMQHTGTIRHEISRAAADAKARLKQIAESMAAATVSASAPTAARLQGLEPWPVPPPALPPADTNGYPTGGGGQ